MSKPSIHSGRLIQRLRELGDIGRDAEGRLTRLAGSDADKLGRDRFVAWIEAAGLDVAIDRIGNVFGIWAPEGARDEAPLMLGSHIDTVINAGVYDGCYGVLGGLEVIETLKETGFAPARPLVVAAFTNEEGVRFAPDMLGSLVYAGGLDLDAALATIGTDGARLGDELRRIGHAGDKAPGFLKPHVYLELHIEQGPVLEREGFEPSISAIPTSGADATVVGTGPTERRRMHSCAPGSPTYSASSTRRNVASPRATCGRGRTLLAVMAMRISIARSRSHVTRNAYHGLGLIGSSSGVTRMR